MGVIGEPEIRSVAYVSQDFRSRHVLQSQSNFDLIGPLRRNHPDDIQRSLAPTELLDLLSHEGHSFAHGHIAKIDGGNVNISERSQETWPFALAQRNGAKIAACRAIFWIDFQQRFKERLRRDIV